MLETLVTKFLEVKKQWSLGRFQSTEKHKAEEVNRSEESICSWEWYEVKVSKDGSDQGEDCVVKGAVVKYLGPEQQISQLDEGREDNEEHDEESQHVSPAFTESSGELSHCLVEGDIFEYFDPGEEGTAASYAVQEVAPEGNSREIHKLSWSEVDIFQCRLHVEVDDSSTKIVLN